MSRYIEADAFDERVRISVGLVEEELTEDYKDGVRCTLEMLKTQPTADVVEVVRCKDCVHCADDWNGNQPMFTCEIAMCHESVEPSGYCFRGEWREDG